MNKNYLNNNKRCGDSIDVYQLSQDARQKIKDYEKQYYDYMYEYDQNGVIIPGSMKDNSQLMMKWYEISEAIKIIRDSDYKKWLNKHKNSIKVLNGIKFVKFDKDYYQPYTDYGNWSKFITGDNEERISKAFEEHLKEYKLKD